MPANLPPQYFEAEKQYREAKTPQDKVIALEEMLRIMPKHKGTDRLQGEIKKKISKFKAEAQKRAKGGKRGFIYHVEKMGAGQIALVGPPNVGKSRLLSTLTNQRPLIADYAFTTRFPVAGMMKFENIQIQLVDLPPISPELTEGWVYGICRNADALFLVLDLSSDLLLDQWETVSRLLEEARIRPVHLRGSQEDPPRPFKMTIIVGNKVDKPMSRENLEVFIDLYGDGIPVVPVSAQTGEGLDRLGPEAFKLLRIIRAYTKTPGKKPDLDSPVILPIGSTVLDFAEQIHKDFVHGLSFARIWGANKYDGQKVQKDYPLSDGDIIELHR